MSNEARDMQPPSRADLEREIRILNFLGQDSNKKLKEMESLISYWRTIHSRIPKALRHNNPSALTYEKCVHNLELILHPELWAEVL